MKATQVKSPSAKSQAKESASSTASSGQDAITLLKQDHRKVETMFEEYKTADEDEKEDLVQKICNALTMHTILEEEIFYRACREKDVEGDILDEAQVEHDSAKLIIQDLLGSSPGSGYYDAKVTTLSEYIKHHVGEEEHPSEGIFAKAKEKGLDMSALGQRLQTRKKELMEKAEANALSPPSPRALQLHQSTEYQESKNMPRYSNYRERDERGRFIDEDDDRCMRSRSSRRYEEDEDDRGRGRGRSGWYGDPEGHSEAARSRPGESRYSRDYDEDEDRGRGRGRGWYGDPEGHAEAARERWEEDDRGRGSRSRSSSRYEDEDEYRGGRGGGRGRSGWYGDPEGHAEAARERREDDDRRGRSYRSRSSSRYEDEDDERGGRSRSGGRDQGGWFGDPEGHARAARRGWRDRD